MSTPEVLYREQGVSRWWLILAPLGSLAVIYTEIRAGVPVHWWQWIGLALFADVFVALQVYAGRTHIGVQLDREQLRCGSESIPVAQIAEILPGFVPDDGRRRKGAVVDPEAPPWTRARTLGQLPSVPRRRYPMGLLLTTGETVQAWAKNDYALRDALAPLLTRPE